MNCPRAYCGHADVGDEPPYYGVCAGTCVRTSLPRSKGARVDRLDTQWLPGLQPRPRAIVLSMIPFAVSGPIVIGVVVAGALLLVVLLLRGEDRYQAEQERKRERNR
jgi:hypothetical protein